MKNKPPKCPVTFRVDVDLNEKLIELAKDKNCTVSSLINLGVRQFLDNSGIETDSKKKGITEIILLLEAKRFNLVGYEKYVDVLKTFAKELNISEENMFKVLMAVLEGVWQLSKS